MRIQVKNTLDDLASDTRKIVADARTELPAVVSEGIRTGNSFAKDLARETSGTHARKYPGTFSASMNKGFSGFGSRIIQGEYGPVARGQGNLAPILENGSRNNPAHNNLSRSADVIGPAMVREVGDRVDSWFWPRS